MVIYGKNIVIGTLEAISLVSFGVLAFMIPGQDLPDQGDSRNVIDRHAQKTETLCQTI